MMNSKASSETRAVMEENPMGLPPGFRFHPTDVEIIVHYLMPKVMNSDFSTVAIGQVDFTKCEPWDLPKVANSKDNEEGYYYCLRDKKYPTGLRTNRATKSGYWKATGKDREIFMVNKNPKVMVGMKKTLVFYKGRAPRGEKTNWVMHEFRLHPHIHQMPKDDYGWVVSRVYQKKGNGIGMSTRTYSTNISSFPQIEDDGEYESLPPLIDARPQPQYTSSNQLKAADSYEEDRVLYVSDPTYYYPNIDDVKIPSNDKGDHFNGILPTKMGSMPDFSRMWDV